MQKKEKAQHNLKRFLSGEKDSAGEDIFNRWFLKKTREPENEHLWKDKSTDEVESRIRTGVFDAIGKELNPGMQELSIPKPYNKGRIHKTKRIVLMAASIALLIIGSTMISQMVYKSPLSVADILNFKNEQNYTNIATPHGKKTIVNLTDGTRIYLNSGSEIRFLSKNSEGKREVFLEGEAFFEVARDLERPFIVHSGNIITTVLGTAFNIRANNSEADVMITVASGKVKVEVDKISDRLEDPVMLLNSNDQMHYNTISGDFMKKQVTVSNITAWKENVLYFDDESLGEISSRLERWFDVEISISDPELEQLRFTGKFEKPILYNILEAISFTTSINYDVKEKRIEWINLK